MNSKIPKECENAPIGLVAVCAMVFALAACTLVTKRSGETVVMSPDEFGKYVEDVFRYHNQVMNELIEAAEDRDEQDTDEARALSAAEARMIESCRPLNDVISEALSGNRVGLGTEMNLVDTVPACEEATHTVDELIP